MNEFLEAIHNDRITKAPAAEIVISEADLPEIFVLSAAGDKNRPRIRYSRF
jgi:hypothetical protein